VAEQQQRAAHGRAHLPRTGPVARHRHPEVGHRGIGVRSGGGGRVPRVHGDGRRQERYASVQGDAGWTSANLLVVRGSAGGQQYRWGRRGAIHRGRGARGQRDVRLRG